MQNDKHNILSKKIKINTFQMIFLLLKKFSILMIISCSNFHSDPLNRRMLPILSDYNMALQQHDILRQYNSFVPVSIQQDKMSDNEFGKSFKERKNTGPVVYKDFKVFFCPHALQKNSQSKFNTRIIRSEDWNSPFKFGSEQIFKKIDLDFVHKNYIPKSPTRSDDGYCSHVTLQTKAILGRYQTYQIRETGVGTKGGNESLQKSKTCETAITTSYKKTTNLSLIKNAKFRKTPEQKSSSDHESIKSKLLMEKTNEIIQNRDNRKRKNDEKIITIKYNEEQVLTSIEEKFFPKNKIVGYYQFFDNSFDYISKKEISTSSTILTFQNKKKLYENWIKDKFSCIKEMVDIIKKDGCDNSIKFIHLLEKNYEYLKKLLSYTDNSENNIRNNYFYNFYQILSELICMKNTKQQLSIYNSFYNFFLRLIVSLRDLNANLKQKSSNGFLYEYEIITDFYNLCNILRLNELEQFSLEQRLKIYVDKNIKFSNKQKIQHITDKITLKLREFSIEHIYVENVDFIFAEYAVFENEIVKKINNHINKQKSNAFHNTHIDNLYAILSTLSLTAMNILIVGNNMNGLSFDEVSNQILTISAAYIRPILQKLLSKYIVNFMNSDLIQLKKNLRLDLDDVKLMTNDKLSNNHGVGRINELIDFYGHTLLFYDFIIDNCLSYQKTCDSANFNIMYENIMERILSFYSTSDFEYK